MSNLPLQILKRTMHYTHWFCPSPSPIILTHTHASYTWVVSLVTRIGCHTAKRQPINECNKSIYWVW